MECVGKKRRREGRGVRGAVEGWGRRPTAVANRSARSRERRDYLSYSQSSSSGMLRCGVWRGVEM